MKQISGVSIFAAMVALICMLAPGVANAQETGSLEILVRVAPAGGRPEPALRLPLYLLKKSFADIRKEAEEGEPEMELDPFIDTLQVSDEMKTWMKKNKMVQLTGQEFVRKLTPDDIFNVPEFLEAYLSRNMNDVAVGFPKPKYKESEKQTNPQKYEKDRREFLDKVRKFLEPNRYTIEGIEVHLTEINAAQLWGRRQADRKLRIQRREMELSQLKYLVTHAETDMSGRALLVNVPAGEYWISSLQNEGVAGSSRLRWDTPVQIQARETTRIELNNLNSLPPPSSAP